MMVSREWVKSISPLPLWPGLASSSSSSPFQHPHITFPAPLLSTFLYRIPIFNALLLSSSRHISSPIKWKIHFSSLYSTSSFLIVHIISSFSVLSSISFSELNVMKRVTRRQSEKRFTFYQRAVTPAGVPRPRLIIKI